jgi:hypothetical protein
MPKIAHLILIVISPAPSLRPSVTASLPDATTVSHHGCLPESDGFPRKLAVFRAPTCRMTGFSHQPRFLWSFPFPQAPCPVHQSLIANTQCPTIPPPVARILHSFSITPVPHQQKSPAGICPAGLCDRKLFSDYPYFQKTSVDREYFSPSYSYWASP